jgi:hypothetical protein
MAIKDRLTSIFLYLYLLTVYSIYMAKRNRRIRKKKKNLRLSTIIPSTPMPETITGNFRIIRSVQGTYIVVKCSKSLKYRLPEQKELNYLVKKKLISKSTGRLVPIK